MPYRAAGAVERARPRGIRYPVDQQTDGDPKPYYNHQPHDGGEIFILPGPLNANVDIPITHLLKRIPQRVHIWDSGTTFKPRPKRGTVAWSFTTATIQIDTAVPMGTNLIGKLI